MVIATSTAPWRYHIHLPRSIQREIGVAKPGQSADDNNPEFGVREFPVRPYAIAFRRMNRLVPDATPTNLGPRYHREGELTF